MLARLACLSLFLIVGCAGPRRYSPKEQRILREHLVAFDAYGEPLNPNAFMRGWKLGDQSLTELDYQQKLAEIAAAAKTFLAESKEHRILVFVHGGMTDHDDSVRRVLAETDEIMASGRYPIFVAWNSGFTTSYLQHLAHDEGEFSLGRLLFSPLIVAKDLVLGIMNLPRRFVEAAKDPFPIFDGELKRAREAASRAQGIESQFNLAVQQQRAQLETGKIRSETASIDLIIPVQIGSFESRGFSDWYRYSNFSAKYVLFPVSAVLSFCIDSLGKRSWQGMLLRTKLLFDDVKDLDKKADGVQRGVSALLRTLKRVQDTTGVRNRDETSPQVGIEALLGGIDRMLQKFENEDYVELFRKLQQAFPEVEEEARTTGIDFLEPVVNPKLFRKLQQALEEYEGKAGPPGIDFLDSLISWLENTGPSAGAELIATGTRDQTEFFQALSLIALAPGDSGTAVGISETLQALRHVDEEIRDEIVAALHDLKQRAADGLSLRGELEPALRNIKHVLEKALATIRLEEPKIDLFVHSMGAIIGNEILRRSSWEPVPRFENLVYMAAACSIRDYEQAVFPYLLAHKSYGSNFYNLMLHPEAEDEENMFYDLIPRGSLLVYIDEYLTEPGTPRDRTLGRFQNTFRAIHGTRPEVADQIHLKVFPAGNGDSAERETWEWDRDTRATETHGGFTPRRFWLESYWKVPSVVAQASMLPSDPSCER